MAEEQAITLASIPAGKGERRTQLVPRLSFTVGSAGGGARFTVELHWQPISSTPV